ncbi:MAG: MBL fold metallo-hydrolase [Alphaproteobacteria bacterium]|nr:MBL fold metallo-hydrolase [Alphaproteobacteria bacterium]
MFKLVSGAVAALMISTVAFGAAEDAEPRIVTYKVNGAVNILYGGNGLGASVGVVDTSEGLVLIDAMRDKTADQLAEALGGVSDKPVSYLFNTHRHEDHTSGNGAFLDNGAVLIRQANAPDGGEVNQIRFADHLAMTIGGVKFEAYSTPSHTWDDVLVYLPKENILFMGDTFTTNWHATFFAAGEKGQIAVIEKALVLADDATLIVPGHGAVTDRKGILVYRDAVKNWMARARALSAKGMGLDEMAADAELQAIANSFLQDGSKEEIPAVRYRRFVERVISTELMPMDASVLPHLGDYVGEYLFEDGRQLRLELAKDRLKAFRNGLLFGTLVPLSKTEFHFPGWLESDGKMIFSFNDAGEVTGVALTNSDASFPAEKVAKPQR